MSIQVCGQGTGIGYVAVHAQGQSLQALQVQECSKWRLASPEIAQAFHPSPDCKRDVGAAWATERPKHVMKFQPVVPRRGLSEHWMLPLPQSKVPASTTAPPMWVPWPLAHFVSDSTTMSAPCLMGWQM
eukprot:323631_1